MQFIIAVVLIILIASCNDSGTSSILTYEELVKFPVRCERADQQLKHLRYIQQVKKFDPDPDNLSDSDRTYNSRLKATIWWYAHQCEKH